MTHLPPSGPGRLARACLGLMTLPLVLLAGCATSLGPPVNAESGIAAPSGATTSTATQPVDAVPAIKPPPVPVVTAVPEAAVAAPAALDPLRPEVRIDADDRSTRIDLWQRVRDDFKLTDLDSDLVRDWERWYASRPDYVQRMTTRGSRYLFHIVEELERRQMPGELALLPFIESAFNPQAVSSARASGMWQFMAATGRDFLLKQNLFRDDRRDVLASTRAALDYLQKLHGMFGDWHLALAAYNWGEGNVQRAIARNQRAGLGTDYASLKMPSETQNYVPKLQAMKNIIARPQQFGLALPELWNHPQFLAVPIERDIDVALAVQLAGMTTEEFQSLNPQMNKPVILAAGTPQILLPYDHANRFVRRLPQHKGPLATWTAWVAPRTMPTSAAAREIGIAEDQLREINKIPLRMVVKAGSTLLVPRTDHRVPDVSVAIADNAMMALAPEPPELRKLSLRAGRKDSVSSVARRYGVSADQVAKWNHTGARSAFRPGQTIVVWVPNKPGVERFAPVAKRVGPGVVQTRQVTTRARAAHPASAGAHKATGRQAAAPSSRHASPHRASASAHKPAAAKGRKSGR